MQYFLSILCYIADISINFRLTHVSSIKNTSETGPIVEPAIDSVTHTQKHLFPLSWEKVARQVREERN